ncbi:BAG family molecular chaperone regulator 1 [Varanus komodoensis]|nr:BAG family molecular chaperone regulator 1 [Varanus komodoensis]
MYPLLNNLISRLNSPEEDAELKKLKDLEKSVEQVAKKIEEVNKELGGIQKGFLAKNLQTEALNQLDKRIKGTAEQFMKILEQIDAIILPENFSDCKQKKKGLVKKLQNFHLSLNSSGTLILSPHPAPSQPAQKEPCQLPVQVPGSSPPSEKRMCLMEMDMEVLDGDGHGREETWLPLMLYPNSVPASFTPPLQHLI